MKVLNKLVELHITADGYYGTYVTYVTYDYKAEHYYTEKEDYETILHDLAEKLKKVGDVND